MFSIMLASNAGLSACASADATSDTVSSRCMSAAPGYSVGTDASPICGLTSARPPVGTDASSACVLGASEVCLGTRSSPGAVPAAPESDMTPVTDAFSARELAAPCKADDEDAGVESVCSSECLDCPYIVACTMSLANLLSWRVRH